MDITNKIDMLLSEEKKWFSSMGNTIYRDMDKKTQVEVIWRPGQKEVKVQFRDSDSREYIGHTMVQTKGMKSKEFLKHVNKDMKNIWGSKKKGMKEEHNLLAEATVPSQSKVRSIISKGLEDVSDITSSVAMGLWHYLDLKIVGKRGVIYKTGKKIKTVFWNGEKVPLIMDELWFRIGKNIEDSERLTDEGLTKLKVNFYSLTKTFMTLYEWNDKENRWEFK